MSFENKKYKIIFAHPDDEILWASSIINNAEKIIICFLESPGNNSISVGRMEATKKFPLNNLINLGIKEINATKKANWRKPLFTKYGIFHKSNHMLYKEKFYELYNKLKDNLKFGDIVVTHNPWGEYGHEEHVLVHNVLTEIKKELQLEIYVTGYVSNRSIYAMSDRVGILSENPIIFKTDINIASHLMQHYKKYKIWTWWDDYKLPKYEVFFLLENHFQSNSNGKRASSFMNHILFNENNITLKDVIKFFYIKILNFFR